MISTVGNLYGRSRNNGLSKVSGEQKDTQTNPESPMQSKMHKPMIQTLSHLLKFLLWSSDWGFGHSHGTSPLVCPTMSPEPHLKTHAVLRTPYLPQGVSSDTEEVHSGPHILVYGATVSVCVRAMEKNITSANMRPMCLCGVMLQKRAYVIKDYWWAAMIGWNERVRMSLSLQTGEGLFPEPKRIIQGDKLPLYLFKKKEKH